MPFDANVVMYRKTKTTKGIFLGGCFLLFRELLRGEPVDVELTVSWCVVVSHQVAVG